MGFNSVFLVLNDYLSQVENDPYFGPHIAQTIRENAGNHRYHDVPGFGGGVQLVGQAHADTLQVYAIGGNRSVLLGYVGDWNATPHVVLEALVERHGFKLVEMRDWERARRAYKDVCDDCAESHALASRSHMMHDGRKGHHASGKALPMAKAKTPISRKAASKKTVKRGRKTGAKRKATKRASPASQAPVE